MSSFEENIAKYNNWSIDFCNKVIFEFERFISIRSNNPNTSPSDYIDKLWHSIILNTEFYIDYCLKKFGKIIHHNTFDSFDLNQRKIRIINTINIYKSTYDSFMYPEIWNCNFDLSISDMEKLAHVNTLSPQIPIPSYNENKPQPDYIKLYINYQNVEKAGSLNKKIIEYKPNLIDTVDKFKDFISNELKVEKNNIALLPHPELKQKNHMNTINDEIINNLLLKNLMNSTCNFFIIEITDSFHNNMYQFNNPLNNTPKCKKDSFC